MKTNEELEELIKVGQSELAAEKEAAKRRFAVLVKAHEAEMKRINNEWLTIAFEHVPSALRDFVVIPTDDPGDRSKCFVDPIFAFDGMVPFLIRIKRDKEDNWCFDAYYLAGIIRAETNLAHFSFDESKCSLVRLEPDRYSLGYVLAASRNAYNYIVVDQKLTITGNRMEIKIIH